jgi:hypothetical protein
LIYGADPDAIFANALTFAFEKATTEGKVTIALLVIVSLFQLDGHHHQGAAIDQSPRDGEEILRRLSRNSRPVWKCFARTRTSPERRPMRCISQVVRNLLIT